LIDETLKRIDRSMAIPGKKRRGEENL